MRVSLEYDYVVGPHACTWTVSARGPLTSLRVPQLPDEAASLRPASGTWTLRLEAQDGDPEWHLHPLGPFSITRSLGDAVFFWGP